jgi:hypothetical protein
LKENICLQSQEVIVHVLKQSPRKWDKKFDSFTVSHNFNRSEYDHCVYFKIFNGIFIILVLYVDDMLVARKNMFEINRLKALLDMTFYMMDLGEQNEFWAWKYIETRKIEIFGYHNKSMWRKYS